MPGLGNQSRTVAAVGGGISGGTPNYDVKKPVQLQMLSSFIRILFAHHYFDLFDLACAVFCADFLAEFAAQSAR
jgi:hypothetical protein